MKYIFLFVLSILFFNLEAQAATITTRQSGNWSDKSTWNGGIVPTASDDVEVKHSVNVDMKTSVKTLTNNGGSLYFWRNYTLTVSSYFTNNDGSVVMTENVSSRLDIGGDVNFVAGTLRIEKGEMVFKGSNISFAKGTIYNDYIYFVYFSRDNKINNQQNVDFGTNILKCYNLRVYNDRNNYGDNSQGVHIAAGTNIQVTNKLTLAAGVLHLGCDKDNNYALDNHHASGNYLWLSAVNTSAYTANLALPSGNQDRCYIDGGFRVSNTAQKSNSTISGKSTFKKLFVCPVGDGERSGYCSFEFSELYNRYGSYGTIEVQHYDMKSPYIGDNSTIYQFLAEEYWSFENIDNETKYVDCQVRIDDPDMLDYSSTTQKGALAGCYWMNINSANTVYDGWLEYTGYSNNASIESVYKTYTYFDAGYGVEAQEGSVVDYISANGRFLFTYGVKSRLADQLIFTIESSVGGNLWTGNADTDWNNDANWLDGVPKNNETAKLTNYWSKTVTINIPVSVTTYSWWEGTQTTTENRDVSHTFTVQPEQFPILNAGDEVASAGSVSIVEDDSKESKAPYLTLNGGALVVANNLSVDNNTEGHIVVNNRYDNSSALKFGNTDYTNLTINRTLEVDRTYYTGSATAEGTFTGVENLNGNNGKSGDYLANYYPNGGGYQKQSDFKYVRGGTFAFFNDATTTHTGTEATLVQVGTPFGTVNGSTNVNDGVIALRSGVGNYDLIENPYLYAFPLDQSGAVSMGTGANRTVWFRRFTDDEGYYWTTYNIGLTGVSEGDTEEDEKEYTLAPQQGFFVKTIATGDENKVVFNPSKITKNNIASGTSVKLKAADAEPDILRLKLSIDGGYSDETAIVFRDGGSMGSVDLESDKWINTTKTRNQIYAVKNDGKQCAIPLYPAISDMQDGEVVNLGVRMSSKSGEGTIRATNIMEFDSDVDVYLHDNETGETIDLRQEDTYAFSAQAGATNNGRFYITLSNKSLPENSEENVEPIADENEGLSTAVADVQTNFIRITSDTERNAIVTLSTNLLSTDAVVNVYDIAGKLIKKQNIDKTETIVPIGLSGVYIVEAISGGQTEKSKVRIR